MVNLSDARITGKSKMVAIKYGRYQPDVDMQKCLSRPVCMIATKFQWLSQLFVCIKTIILMRKLSGGFISRLCIQSTFFTYVPWCFWLWKHVGSRWNSVATLSGSWDITFAASTSGLWPPFFISRFPVRVQFSHVFYNNSGPRKTGIAIGNSLISCLQTAIEVFHIYVWHMVAIFDFPLPFASRIIRVSHIVFLDSENKGYCCWNILDICVQAEI